jgi:hypothetical protein
MKRSGKVLLSAANTAAHPDLAKLSVIIPVGPGDAAWRPLLSELHFLPDGAQIIVVFCAGETPCDSAALNAALRANVHCIEAPTGRAQQQNAGVSASTNPTLWFLHADSRLAARTASCLQRAIARQSKPPTLYYFDLRFFDGSPLMRINQLGVWWRSRLFKLPFGDQALLISRENFMRLGGFDATLSGAEDHALVASALRAGLKIAPIGTFLYTSARRYSLHGWLATTARHLRLSWQQARRFR